MGRRERRHLRGVVRAAARQGRPRSSASGDVYVVDAFAGADPAHRIAVRVVTGSPWHALFAKTLFIDPTPRGARGHGDRRARPACAVRGGRPGGGRDAHRDLRRPPPLARGGADRRHLLRGRDQEVDLHAPERPPSARGRLPDALLGEPRTTTARSRSSSASREPARRRSRPIPDAISSATTSTAGRTRASSTSRAAATRR